MRLQQSLFSIRVDSSRIRGGLAGLISEDVDDATLDYYLEDNQLRQPPLLVQEVTYGRVVYYSVTATDDRSSEQLAADLRAAWGAVEVTGSARTQAETRMRGLEVEAIGVGIGSTDAAVALRSLDWTRFLTAANATTLFPISVRYVYAHRPTETVVFNDLSSASLCWPRSCCRNRSSCAVDILSLRRPVCCFTSFPS